MIPAHQTFAGFGAALHPAPAPPDDVVFAMEIIRHILTTAGTTAYADRDLVKRLLEWSFATIVKHGEREARLSPWWTSALAIAALGVPLIALLHLFSLGGRGAKGKAGKGKAKR